MKTLNREQHFAKEVDKLASKLYSKSEWDDRRERYESAGIDLIFSDMQSDVLCTLYDQKPELFKDYNWINDDSGIPLWVKPGVDWIPDYEMED